MKKNTFLILTIIAVMSAVVTSCKKTPAPTAEIFATIDGYTVTFNPTVTDVDTYLWDFGESGSETSTEKNPVHTYALSGTYIVTLNVKGEGGEKIVTKEITIAASFLEMLTGGESASSGKTWVLDRAFTAGDGGGPVMNPPYTLDQSSAEDVLDIFGLGAEYDNEYTFYADGRYSVNPKNGTVLAGAVYGYASGTIAGDPAWDIGMCAAAWSAPASATWTLNNTNLVVEAIGDPNDTNPIPVHGNVTITGKTWISISSTQSQSFFGIKDFPTTTQFIVDDITPNKMRVTLFLCGYSGDAGEIYNMMPTNMIHLSYIKK
jgi:PKD repeat protein